MESKIWVGIDVKKRLGSFQKSLDQTTQWFYKVPRHGQ